MSKLILTLSFFFLGITNLFAQQSSVLTLNADSVYTYEKVFAAPGKTKDQIFDIFKSWVLRNVQPDHIPNYFDDADKYIIAANPVFAYGINTSFDFKMYIEIKNGKYKLYARSFMWHCAGGPNNLGDFSGSYYSSIPKEQLKVKVMKDVDNVFTSVINSLQKTLDVYSSW